MKKQETIKKLKQLMNFLEMPPEELIKEYPELNNHDTYPFKVGYARTELKWLIRDLGGYKNENEI